MKGFIKIVIIFFCFPSIVYSQTWKEYSDSLLYFFKQKNDINNSNRIIKLADDDIALNNNIITDTIYAEYLYRKGIVKSYQNYNATQNFKESLEIWNFSSTKNRIKIIKLNYFLATSYFLLANKSSNISDSDSSIFYFQECYSLVKKYSLQSSIDFGSVLYGLSFLNYKNENYKSSSIYSEEYIEFKKINGINDFDFEYINALKFKGDSTSREKILVDYLSKYDKENLNNPALLFRIYFELFSNKISIINNSYIKNPQEVIKLGEKAVEVYFNNNLSFEIELETVYLNLELAYEAIKDESNSKKYRNLNYQNRLKAKENDFDDELRQLYDNENYNEFKIKFNEYETLFKEQKNFNKLLQVYSYSLNLLEKNILFNKEEVKNQFKLIIQNKGLLTNDNIIFLDKNLSEFYIILEMYNESLELCNKYLNTDNLYYKLKFHQLKYTCEYLLGKIKDATLTAKKSLDVATKVYGKNDARLLTFLSAIIDLDNLYGENPKIINESNQVLKIIYENKLEMSLSSVGIWLSLGRMCERVYNLKDAYIYYSRALNILDNSKAPNPYQYYSCLLSLSNVCISQNNFVASKEFLNKAKFYIDNNRNFTKVIYGDYYYALANYYFNQDMFALANTNYEKSFSYHEVDIVNKRKFRKIICGYFIDSNYKNTIDELYNFQRCNKDDSWSSKLIYLLNFNSGDTKTAKTSLLSLLTKQVLENNKYFHLLSDYDKEILFTKFSPFFEFSNNYLLDNDQKFLNEYIPIRFYSKSLLFLNSFKSSDDDNKNKELYDEYKFNNIQISKFIEKKNSNSIQIEALKNRNREIEKLLSENKKSYSLPNLESLKKALNSDEAYVEIIRINKQHKNDINKPSDILNFFTDTIFYGAIIIKKNFEPRFILIDSNNKLESQIVTDFKVNIKNKYIDTVSYHFLFEKIDNEIGNVKKIYLVTDGIYNSINVESIYNPKNNQFVIDYLNIKQVQNITSITEDKKETTLSPSLKVTLLGNPNFNLTIQDSSNKFLSSERELNMEVLNAISGSVKISPLRGTENEIQSIKSILHETNCNPLIYLADSATEDNIKKVKSPNILHLATHGYFIQNNETSKTKRIIHELFNENFTNDSYLKSGLLLAGAQNTINGVKSWETNNGILTAEEAKNLDLKQTDLVVLSACETGLGDNRIGEGVIGLPRAFMIAGAKKVIMSLWSVNDQATQKLMTIFYNNWFKKNMGLVDAFYNAKLEMKKLNSQPYYWAGFVLLE